MDLTRLLLEIRKNPAIGIAVAAVLTAAAVLLRMTTPITLTYVTFYPAIIMATLAGGWILGVGAMLLATACAAYFFVPPMGSMALTGSDVWNAGAFWVVCSVIIVLTNLLVHLLTSANQKAEHLAELNDRLARAETQQGVLMRELAHRMKNQYAVILAMARATEGSTHTAAEFQNSFSERLQSMSRAHDLLTRQGWEAVSLTDLIRSELDAFAEHGRLEVQGSDVRLKEQAVVNFGMALHELATNATKYGAWSKPGGRVSISWSLDKHGLTFRWVESDGPAVIDGKRRGFGRSMLEKIVPNSLQGSAVIAYEASGFCWTLTVPVSWLEDSGG